MQNNILLRPNLDYTGDKGSAMSMAQGIQNYYAAKGYMGVLVEVIPRVLTNSQGDRVAVHWDIRSNLRFNVADAYAGRVL